MTALRGSWGLAAKLARRELRGGLAGFRVFLACLALGVMAIAAVGMVRSAIEGGLRDQGAILLGGDAKAEFTYRYADDDERAYLQSISTAMSEVIDFRSMAVKGEEIALVQVKAVDQAYPLLGEVVLQPAQALSAALQPQGEIPSAVAEQILVDRLGLALGDQFQLGAQSFRLAGVIEREPDSASQGFGFGPKVILRSADLAASGLLGPGAMFDSEYRMILPEGTDLVTLKAEVEGKYRDKGLRWQDSRRAAPGVERFVDRMGSFLILVGLAGLAVGGVGISAAVRSYLAGKSATIATLKTLGAESGLIFRIYLLQIGALAALGVALGLIAGVALPLAASPLIAASLPMPVRFGIYPAPLAQAAFFGLMTAAIFALWPLAKARGLRAAALYRDGGADGHAGKGAAFGIALLVALVLAAMAGFSGEPRLALGAAAGLGLALVLLAVAARGLGRIAQSCAKAAWLRGRAGLRLAVAAIGAAPAETRAVVLSLGLGLTVLAAIGQIEQNLRHAISAELPERAPSYFFLDIQPDQIDGFLTRTQSDPKVSKVESAPQLRAVVSKINGRPASEVAGGHWVVRGDRGLTYAAKPPEGTRVVEGAWWPEDYQGPPQVSFARKEAEEIGLKLGDQITVNVLGREITATLTSLREVDFSGAGIGFVMTLNPAALAGAPHTHIATVYAAPEAEAQILRDLAKAYPNITAIRIKDVVERASEVVAAISTASSWAALATLVTGFVVLIGAAAAGEGARVYEAAILKTLGATRTKILASFALRAALTGAAAGLVALGAGAAAAWAVMRFVMEVPFHFAPLPALAVILGGMAASLLAGLAFAWRPLARRPAGVLRAQD